MASRHIWYDHPLWYYVWKPAWIPTTFGQQYSFLEELIDQWWSEIMYLQKQWSTIVLTSKSQGWYNEYGLINRLDNDTAGLLFFAKDQPTFLLYQQKQSRGEVQKIYYADLQGNCFEQLSDQFPCIVVSTPLFHHRSDLSRMTTDPQHARWREHRVYTSIEPLFYNHIDDTTTCRIVINKWIRHQIRVHSASLWYPIKGDRVYTPKKKPPNKNNLSWEQLHLRSMWIRA